MTLDNDCKICKKEVCRKNKWLSCQKCHDWYHVECLGKKYEKAYFIFEEENVWWVCNECKGNVLEEWKKEEEDRLAKGVNSDTDTEVSKAETDHDYGGARPKRKQGKAQDKEEGKNMNTNTEEERPEPQEGDKTPKVSPQPQRGDKAPVESSEPHSKAPKGNPEPQRGNKAPVESPKTQKGEKVPKKSSESQSGGETPAESPEPRTGDKTSKRNEEPRRRNTWVGVGRGAWDRLQKGHTSRRSRSKPASNSAARKKVWIFGDSLMRGVGRELHFLTKGGWKIEDRSEGGADIRRIEEIMAQTFEDEVVEENDYVLIEGGGNALTWLGESETIRTIERMVKMAKDKVKENVVVMNIPMRRGMERGRYGKTRRSVNRKCLDKMEEWRCDGIQLCEAVDWDQVWDRDGIHLTLRAKVWVAMVVEEWLRTRGKENTGRREDEEAGTR